ncbi:MAG: energy transducer TonB, partial [Thermoanaerobaculia bacterium]
REERIEDVELRFGRELLRRVFALDRETPSSGPDDEVLAWLATDEAGQRLRSSRLMKYLTDREREALGFHRRLSGWNPSQPEVEIDDANRLSAPPFDVPAPLPAGVGDALAGRCRGGWTALSSVELDARSRVTSVALDPFYGARACRKAVEAMIRLSLPTNRSMSSPHAGRGLVTVGAPYAKTACLDEALPDACAACESEGQALRIGAGIDPPDVKTRVDPTFTAAARETMRRRGASNHVLMMEAIITREGCVRNPRILIQTPIADLNTAALRAVSQWTFEPGRLDGEPVDVIFHLTVNFGMR